MANLENLIRLKNLNYSDLVKNLSSVCRGNYNLPNVCDELTTVNNEVAFKSWKERLLLKYPNADILIKPLSHWFDRVSIIDQSYEYEKSIFVSSKESFNSLLH